METIYEIYIGDYHWETAIDMLGLTILWNEAKRIAKQRKEKVSYREVKVTCQEIGRMQVDKFRAAEKRWAEEDRLLALMK